MYDAFRRIVDFFYLNDLSVLDKITDSTEILEMIKLTKQYQLDRLFRAAESYFREIMLNWFENSSYL